MTCLWCYLCLTARKKLGTVPWVGCSGNLEWRDALENSRCEVLSSFHCRGSASSLYVKCLRVREFGCAEVSQVLSSSSSLPPPPALVCDCDWLVTVLNNFNWLASAVGGSQTPACCGSPRKSILIFDHVGSKDSPLPSERGLQKCYLHLFNSALCLLPCLVPHSCSLLKIWRRRPPSLHNLSTLFFGFELDSLSSLPLALFLGLCCLMGVEHHHYNCDVTHILTHVHVYTDIRHLQTQTHTV